MPVYNVVVTPAELETTLPNHIREGNPNPFLEPVLENDSVWIEQDLSLCSISNFADGEGENYRKQYYKNLFSASTTAGYTNMRQVTFTRRSNMITGYQYGVPLKIN